MADTGYILKTPELEPSQDYEFLRQEGLRHIEKLGSALWTDFNIHDPGITFLEHLCYALTDLGYRTGYDIADLLAASTNGVVVNSGNFHTARPLLTCNPVTFDDLRKLIIDVKGVRNAWIETHESVVYCLDRPRRKLVACQGASPAAVPNEPLNGLYDVFIEFEEFAAPTSTTYTLAVGPGPAPLANPAYIHPEQRGIRFDALHDLVLDAVTMYPEEAKEVVVRLLDAGGNVLAKTEPGQMGPGPVRVPLDFRVPEGRDYRLDAVGTKTKLHHESTATFPLLAADMLCLTAGVAGNIVRQRHYFFFDWEFRADPNRCSDGTDGLRQLTIAPFDGDFGGGAYIRPQSKYIELTAARDVNLVAATLYPAMVGRATIRLLDTDGNLLENGQREVDLAMAESPNRVELNFALKAGQSYRLSAAGTEVDLFRQTGVDYPLGEPYVAQLTGGYSGVNMLYFFFDLELEYDATPPAQRQTATVTRDLVVCEVRDRLHRHRNLCEDFVNVCKLKQEHVAVCADVEVGPDVNVEQALAEMFFAIGDHVSPRVRFHTIDELRDRGKTTAEIFSGPPLDHGFIDDDEFQALKRRCEIRSSDVIRLMMAVDGVLAVRNIALLSFAPDLEGPMTDWLPYAQESWLLPLNTDYFQAPVFNPELSKFIFYKNDLPYFPDFTKVEELLRALRAETIETKLKGHEMDLAVPVGEFRDLAAYYPIQNEIPATYRVGLQRVEGSATDLRKAQSRQLKAYLLFYEQLLANYLAQLANVRGLFSWETADTRTYFGQTVTEIAQIEDLYDSAALRELLGDTGTDADDEDERHRELLEELLPTGLDTILESDAEAARRRAGFLEHLVARYCESFTPYSALMRSLLQDDVAALEREITDKRAFLADYPQLSGGRGQAYDYRRPTAADNISGLQRRAYLLLGIGDLTRRDFAGRRFVLEEVGDEWRFLLQAANDATVIVLTSETCTNRSATETLLDFALSVGGSRENWEIEDGTGDGLLVRRCADGTYEIIARTEAGADLDEIIAYFAGIHAAEGFHVVENILLRRRYADDPFLLVQVPGEDDEDCHEVTEPYSFRAAVLLPSWPVRFRNLEFRRHVEDTLRREAPAHVYLRICWVNHAQMARFELCQEKWATDVARLADHGGCRPRGATDPVAAAQRQLPPTGELPLPEPQCPAVSNCGDCDHELQCPGYKDHRTHLEELIDTLHNLVNVYPLARLYDCRNPDAESIPVSLDNTSLGTF